MKKNNQKGPINFNSLLLALSVTSIMFSVYSCSKDPQSPGYEFMPDMYRSPAYKTYGINTFYGDSMEARNPIAGTIARGTDLPYPYPNTLAGYDSAGAHLKNPYQITPEMVAEGERLFKLYCMHCHGEKGMGDGKIIQNEKFPAPPSYSGQLKDLPEGKMFHTITYGKNLMGSHASQLSQKERWTIISYVQTLQKIGQTTVVADSSAAATSTSTAK